VGRAGEETRFGVLPILALNILKAYLGFEPFFKIPEPEKLPRYHEYPDGRTPPGRMGAGGYAMRVRLAMINAKAFSYDGVIAVVDRDGKCNKDRIKELREGRDRAHEYGSLIPCALGVAIETIEAWILGDREALKQGLGFSPARPVAHPEKIWGNEGSGNHPKDRIRDLFAQDDSERSDPEMVRDVVSLADPATLKRTCPAGFAPFAEEVETNIGLVFR